MSFSPPTVFADGTVLTAAALEGDYEALRVYLHRGIIAGDLKTSAPWIDTKHIQPPERNPFSGVQHGVSGHQGGQWAGGVDVRLAFATKFLSGNGRPGNTSVHGLQQTSFSLAIRRAAKILYHYWFEVENGKDESTAPYQTSEAYRFAYIVPWVGNISTALSGYSFAAQEVGATDFGLQSTYPRGLQQPLAIHGGYGSRQGTLAYDYNAVGTATFGLAVHGLSDRCGVVNWGVSIEAFYL